MVGTANQEVSIYTADEQKISDGVLESSSRC